MDRTTGGGGDIMGIRFFCPNGHKLNVKDFQAGRTGICPFCGEKMKIPLESTRPSSKEERRLPQGGASTIAEFSEPAAQAEPQRPSSPMPATRGAASAAPVRVADPLTEGGEVVWYVRPASGGQYGPAGADVMRSWLAEGRVGADSLVWREGWRDWQTAADVFPQLSSNQPIPGLEAVVPDLAVKPVRSHPVPARRRAVTRNTQVAWIGSLVLVVAVLFIILLVVLLKK
jgi:hypothetical protein